MTVDIAIDNARAARTVTVGANQGASYLVASHQVAARTLKKFVRTPALIVAGTAPGALFLLIFRYVFGGAVAIPVGSRTSTSWCRVLSSRVCSFRGWVLRAESPMTSEEVLSIGCEACRSGSSRWSPAG